MMDRYDCRREVEESVDYEILCGRYGREDMDEVVELITDQANARDEATRDEISEAARLVRQTARLVRGRL